jgi:hypothetical protein
MSKLLNIILFIVFMPVYIIGYIVIGTHNDNRPRKRQM